ncbi:TPA: hypothetical protein QDB08_002671 [Burkholderia vietnamiensis]|uniref:hypothetical protein n=1 Tax=Burkholderia vietnamiensis TaxID=60552 RepID=UPI0015933CA0|nr:hypothetical protein [Burkholderia vietnamiensis]HDR9009701.1 hypothetical protein [Burkholderia vietnamiensis]HDR9013746.1 hypothetical protein [Burkholderia vietnamiensis]
MEQTRLLAILDEVRPKRALLTTFTFSPGWFEAFCYPVLRLGGCEKIDVLVDSRHACHSTAESSSHYAGNAYRVVPVYMKSGGFFHPKLAYLERSADDVDSKGDVLIVGSGNLTFAGQGSNLEVLDAVNSYEHPLVFQQISEFFEQFATRTSLSSETRRVLLQYATRAQAAAKAAPPEAFLNPTVWLVHTLESTAADQFAARCTDIGPVSQLTVLAPYHDPEGLSVALLKEDTQADSLRIGMSEPKRIAPFDPERKSLPAGTEFVVVQNRETRFAHAKVFEAVSPRGCVLMTGSVNATEQSLYSTGNVEVVLIRRLDSTPFEWAVEQPETYVACDFETANVNRAPALDAQLLLDGTLRGTVAPVPSHRDCRLVVWSGSRIEGDDAVIVEDDGTFTVEAFQLKEDRSGSRLIVLTSDDFVAQGWLNVEAELRLTPREKDVSRAAARVSAGRATAADLWAIYDVLKRALQHKPPVRAIEERKEHSEGALSRDTVMVDHPYESWSGADFGDLGASTPLEMQCLVAAFHHLNHIGSPQTNTDAKKKLGLLRNKNDEFGLPGTSSGTEPEDDSDSTGIDGNSDASTNSSDHGDSTTDKERAEAAMLQALPEGLAKDATHPLLSGAVQLSATDALRRAFSRRESLVRTGNVYFASADLAFGLDDWLARYSVFAYSDSNRRNLLPAFCAIACCAVWFASPESASTVCGRVKEAVRALAGGDLPDADDWRAKVERIFRTPRFQRIADMDVADREAIVATVPSILASTSLTEALEQLITNVFNGGKLPELPDVYAPVINALLKRRNRPPSNYDSRRFGVVATADDVFRCPACNTNFDDIDELRALRATRAAVHVKDNCRRSIFLGLDVKALKARLPANVEFGVYKERQ